MASNDPSPRWLEEDATKSLLESACHEEEAEEESLATEQSPPNKKKRRSERHEESRCQSNERETRRRRITKPFFAVLSTFTVLLSFVSVAYNLYLIATKDKDTNSILPRIHRGFAIVLAFPAILNESGIKWWRKLCPILSNFFVRGFFYCLIACLSIEDFSPSGDNVMGFVFLSLGLLYVALGMLCVRRHVEIT
jgi:hypothetical protein